MVYESHTEGSGASSQALLIPNVSPLLMIFFSRIFYFLSQRGIHFRNEFTLALCHLILRTETLNLTFLRQTVACYREYIDSLLKEERRCLSGHG